MNIRTYFKLALASLSLFFFVSLATAAQTWQALELNGGTVNALVQTAQGDNLYAATPYGVYLSRNQGASWQGFMRGLQGAAVQNLVLDEAMQRLVALTDKGLFVSLWVNGELIWQPFNRTEAATAKAVAFDAGSGVMYAVLDGQGLFQRTREATAWTLVNAQAAAWQLQRLTVLNSGALLAQAEQALFVSNDAGAHWQMLAAPANIRQWQVLDAQRWWLLTENALWKTLDGGQTWQAVALPRAAQIYSFFVHPREAQRLYLSSSDGNFSSHDGGQTWGKLLLPARDVEVQTWAVHPQADVLYAGTQRLGMFKSNAQAEFWEVARFGLQATNITALQVTAQEPRKLYAAVQGVGLFKNQNEGREWLPFSLGLPNKVNDLLAFSEQALYAATAQGIFSVSQAGLRWLPELSDIAVYRLSSDPLNSERVYAATAQGVYAKDLNAAQAWQLVGLAGLNVVAVVGTPSGALYAATDAGLLYHSADTGATWALLAYLSTGVVQDLHWHSSIGLLAATDTGAWRYANGVGWQALSDLNFAVYQFASHAQHSNTLYAATANGIFRSLDAGLSWHSFNQGLPLLPFQQLRLSTQPTRIYAASQGAGVFMLSLDDLQEVGLSNAILSSLTAEQLSILPASRFAAFDADSVSLLPPASLQGLNSQQLTQLSADALSGLSVAQFLQIPASALFGLHTDNFSGLSRAVLQSFSPDTLQALDQALLRRLDSKNLSRLLQAIHAAQTSTGLDINQQLPANWQFSTLTGAWLLPADSPLPISVLPNEFETPDLGAANLFSPMQAVLDTSGFSGYQASQNNDGIVWLNTTDSGYAYLPTSAIQASPLVSAGWQTNALGQAQLTTAEHQQISLNPTTYAVKHLSALVGEAGWVWLNEYGDALLYDTRVTPPQYRMLSFAAAYTRNSPEAVGIQQVAANQFKLIYPDTTQQIATAAIPQPQGLLDALYRLGAELAIYQMDGTALAQFGGVRYSLHPQAELTVTNLASDAEQPSQIWLNADAQGNLWLDYQVQWKNLSFTTHLRVETNLGQYSAQATWWRKLKDF